MSDPGFHLLNLLEKLQEVSVRFQGYPPGGHSVPELLPEELQGSGALLHLLGLWVKERNQLISRLEIHERKEDKQSEIYHRSQHFSYISHLISLVFILKLRTAFPRTKTNTTRSDLDHLNCWSICQ